MGYKLSELISRFGGKLDGADVEVSGIAPTNLAKDGQITFLTAAKYKKDLANCRALAIILNEEDASLATIPKIITKNPYLYFSQVSNLFHPAKRLKAEIAKTAVIGHNSQVGDNAAISDYVVIGKNSKVGKNCQIYPNVTIGDNVVIGDNVQLYPNVTIYDQVTMGNDCVIHSGTVIGADGFGYARDEKNNWHKIPQVGGVIIGNRVHIGSNTTIDCGALEPTIIEDGVILDNLIQIAHNITIGAHTAIAACTGIAGGTKIGKFCQIAGGANINGQIEIADHTVIGATTAIAKSITKPDLYFGTYPASTYKEWARGAVHIKNLDEIVKKVKALEIKLASLAEGDVNAGK